MYTSVAALLLLASSSPDTAHALYPQEQSLVDIEMPGQHVSGDEPVPDSTVYVERISSSVVVVRRHSSSFRRLGFIGSDGRTRFFIVQVGPADGDLLCIGVSHAAAWSSACLLCTQRAASAQHHVQQRQVHVCCLLSVALQMGSTGTAPHSISCTAPCGSSSLPQSVSAQCMRQQADAQMRRC